MNQLKQFEKAAEYFQASMDIAPPLYWLPFMKLAQVKKEQGDYEAALKTLKTALQRCQREELYQELASIHMKMDKVDEAIQALETAQSVNPYDDYHWRYAAALLLDNFKLKKAIAMLNNALEIFKGYPGVLSQHYGDLYALRAVGKSKLNLFKEAMDDLTTASSYGQKVETESSALLQFLGGLDKFISNPPDHLKAVMSMFPPEDGTVLSFSRFYTTTQKHHFFPLAEQDQMSLAQYYCLHIVSNPSDAAIEAENVVAYCTQCSHEGIVLAAQHSGFLYILCLYWKKEGWAVLFTEIKTAWKTAKDNVDRFWEQLEVVCSKAPLKKYMK